MLLVASHPAREAAGAVRAAWDCGTAVALVDPAAPAGRADALRADEPVAPEVAAVITTSGTTGEPRAVELTWDGLKAMVAAGGAAPSDRWLACLPLHHVAGLAVVARAWASGARLTVLDRADPGDVAGALGPGGADATALVPTQVLRLLAAGVDLSGLRRILVGGGPVPAAVHGLPNVVATYGLTETWGGVVHDGRPLPGVEVTLAGDGEILVRSPTVMRGYRLDPAATAAAFTPDGRLRTGDVGAWEEGGTLRVVDRRRDLIITGGVNVSPTEVERVLAGHPGVGDVCVAGRPDDEWGERVVAFVVPADPSRPPGLSDLREFGRPHLAGSHLPRQVVVVEAIPRTPGGKPLRRRLPGTG